MVRRLGLCLVVLGALAVTPAAFAGYPTPMAQQGGLGVKTPDGTTRFLALAAGGNTVIAKIATADGSLRKSKSIGGSFGVPVLVYGGAGEGVSRDGSFFVLQSTGISIGRLPLQRGQRRSEVNCVLASARRNLQHQTVRRQALAQDLHMNPGGYPFIHALDTVRAVAHCVGLPWASSNQGALSNAVLSLRGKTLAVHWTSGKPWLNVNTVTWRTSHARASSSFPWLWLTVGLGSAAAALALVGALIRRRRRPGALRISPALEGLAK